MAKNMRENAYAQWCGMAHKMCEKELVAHRRSTDRSETKKYNQKAPRREGRRRQMQQTTLAQVCNYFACKPAQCVRQESETHWVGPLWRQNYNQTAPWREGQRRKMQETAPAQISNYCVCVQNKHSLAQMCRRPQRTSFRTTYFNVLSQSTARITVCNTQCSVLVEHKAGIGYTSRMRRTLRGATHIELLCTKIAISCFLISMEWDEIGTGWKEQMVLGWN